MKGAKGGKRDRDISYKYHIKNTVKEQEFLDEALKAQDERIYEDKVKTSQYDDVTLSPLTDKDIDTDGMIEKKADVKVEDEIKLEEIDDLKKKKEEEIYESAKKKKEKETIIDEEIEQIDEKEIDDNEDKILEEVELKEAYIFYELEKVVKEDLFDLRDIESRVREIEDELEDEYMQDEIDELRRELEILLEKFEKLKYKYDNFDFDIHPDIDDSYIETLISSYGDSIKDETKISDLIENIEETKSYIGIIETVAYTENKIKDLDNKVTQKYDELGIRDVNFTKLEDETIDIEKINDEVKYITYDIENNLNLIREDLDSSLNIESYTKTISKTIPRVDRVVNAALMITTAAFIPGTMRGNVIRAGLMAGAIHNLAHVLESKETTKVKSEVNFVDYSSEIIESAKSINDVSYIVDEALEDIDTIRYKLNTEFREYIDLMPEYKTLIGNIDRMEKELEEQKYLIEKYEAQVHQQLHINNEKRYIKDRYQT